MKTTLKNFQNLAKLADNTKPEKELIVEYQQSKKPEIFCLMFCRYYQMMNSTANQFFNLTEHDISSFATEELSKALLDFNPCKGSGNLGGLLKKYLFNRLRSETEKLANHKRKINFQSEYLDSMRDENGNEMKNQISDCRDYFSFFDVFATIQSFKLTANQLKYCVEVMSGNEVDSDIADKLGISSAAVFKMKKSLRIKFEPIL